MIARRLLLVTLIMSCIVSHMFPIYTRGWFAQHGDVKLFRKSKPPWSSGGCESCPPSAATLEKGGEVSPNLELQFRSWEKNNADFVAFAFVNYDARLGVAGSTVIKEEKDPRDLHSQQLKKLRRSQDCRIWSLLPGLHMESLSLSLFLGSNWTAELCIQVGCGESCARSNESLVNVWLHWQQDRYEHSFIVYLNIQYQNWLRKNTTWTR